VALGLDLKSQEGLVAVMPTALHTNSPQVPALLFIVPSSAPGEVEVRFLVRDTCFQCTADQQLCSSKVVGAVNAQVESISALASSARLAGLSGAQYIEYVQVKLLHHYHIQVIKRTSLLESNAMSLEAAIPGAIPLNALLGADATVGWTAELARRAGLLDLTISAAHMNTQLSTETEPMRITHESTFVNGSSTAFRGALVEAFVAVSSDSTLDEANQTMIGRLLELEQTGSDKCTQLDQIHNAHRQTKYSRRSLIALTLGGDTGLHQVVQSLTGKNMALLQMLPLRKAGIALVNGLVDAAEVPWQGVFAGQSISPGFHIAAQLDIGPPKGGDIEGFHLEQLVGSQIVNMKVEISPESLVTGCGQLRDFGLVDSAVQLRVRQAAVCFTSGSNPRAASLIQRAAIEETGEEPVLDAAGVVVMGYSSLTIHWGGVHNWTLPLQVSMSLDVGDDTSIAAVGQEAWTGAFGLEHVTLSETVMKVQSEDLGSLATLSATMQLGCDGPGSCLKGSAAVVLNLEKNVSALMVGATGKATLHDVLDVLSRGHVDTSTAAVTGIMNSVNLTAELRLAYSSSPVQLMGSYEIPAGASVSSEGFIFGSQPVQLRGLVRPISDEHSTAAVRLELRMQHQFLLADWMKFSGSAGATGPLVRLSTVLGTSNLTLAVEGRLSALGMSNDTVLQLSPDGTMLTASLEGHLFGGAFACVAQLHSPAGELDSPLPFQYTAQLKRSSLDLLTMPLEQLLVRRVTVEMQELVKLYARLATAASAQGIRVMQSTGQAVIDTEMEPVSLVKGDLIDAYRRAYRNFDLIKNATRGLDLLASSLIGNHSKSAISRRVLHWCSAAVSGRVADEVDSTQTVLFDVLFMGYQIQFAVKINLLNPSMAAELMFEALWKHGVSRMQLGDVHVDSDALGMLQNATFGQGVCQDVVEGVIALDETPLDFELPLVDAMLAGVGLQGSVKYLPEY